MKLFVRPLRLLMLGCILFAYSNDLIAEQTPFGDLDFPWEVTVGLPSGAGPHTALVQAAFDEALLLQRQLGPGGVVRFPPGNHMYQVGHLDPTGLDTYIGVTVEDFDGYVLGEGAIIQSGDPQPLIDGLAWGAYYILRFNGGDIKLAQLNFIIAAGSDQQALGLFQNSSTIRDCHFEGEPWTFSMGRGISIGSEFAGGTTLVLSGVAGWHTEGDGGDPIGSHSIFDNSFANAVHGVVVIRADGGVVNIFDNTCENCINLAYGWGNSGTKFIASDNSITDSPIFGFALGFGNQGALGTTHRLTSVIESSRVIFTNNYIADGCWNGIVVADDVLDPTVISGSADSEPERALNVTISGNELRGCSLYSMMVSGFKGEITGNTVTGPGFVGMDVGWEYLGSYRTRTTERYKLAGNTVHGFIYDIYLEPTTSEVEVRGGKFDHMVDEGTNNSINPVP
jgi:hypothetical protein